MSFNKIEQEEFDWELDDEILEVRRSNLRRARNAHLLIGAAGGIATTLGCQYIFFWAIGVF